MGPQHSGQSRSELLAGEACGSVEDGDTAPKLLAKQQESGASPVGEESEGANADEAFGKQV